MVSTNNNNDSNNNSNNNNNLMYSTHNEDKSAIAEMFIKTLKAKIYKKMAAKDNKSYLNKLVNQYNNTYYHSVGKKECWLFCFD